MHDAGLAAALHVAHEHGGASVTINRSWSGVPDRLGAIATDRSFDHNVSKNRISGPEPVVPHASVLKPRGVEAERVPLDERARSLCSRGPSVSLRSISVHRADHRHEVSPGRVCEGPELSAVPPSAPRAARLDLLGRVSDNVRLRLRPPPHIPRVLRKPER